MCPAEEIEQVSDRSFDPLPLIRLQRLPESAGLLGRSASVQSRYTIVVHTQLEGLEDQGRFPNKWRERLFHTRYFEASKLEVYPR